MNLVSKLNNLNVNSYTNESFLVLNVTLATTICDAYTLPVIINGWHMNDLAHWFQKQNMKKQLLCGH